MFIVRRVERGWFSDNAVLEALGDGVLTRRWLDWDRLGAPILRPEPSTFASGEVFTLRVPKRSLNEYQTFSTKDLEAFHLKPLKKLPRS